MLFFLVADVWLDINSRELEMQKKRLHRPLKGRRAAWYHCTLLLDRN